MAFTDGRNVFLAKGPETIHQRLVKAALERLDRGTYGLCVDCGRPIERARLEESPIVAQCGACSRGTRRS
jgi:RNA polymerase-binding transcription factor DksA